MKICCYCIASSIIHRYVSWQELRKTIDIYSNDPSLRKIGT